MRKRFTEEQIIGFLREAEAGMPIKDLCRQHGFSEVSYYPIRSIPYWEMHTDVHGEFAFRRFNGQVTYYTSLNSSCELAGSRLVFAEQSFAIRRPFKLAVRVDRVYDS